MSWIATGATVVGAVGGLMGGSKSGERAAKDAAARANYQLENATAGAKADLSPFKETGIAANQRLAQMLGIDTSGYAPRPTLEQFQNQLRDEHFKWAGQDYNRNSNIAGQNAEADRRYQEAMKNWESGLEKYKANNQGAMGGGELLKNFSNEDFVKDPGYEFRMSEGEKGINRSMAARGGFDSGSALKALNRYNQDFASNEFGNAFNRDASNKSRIYSFLSGTAGAGQNAATTGANMSIGAASQAGQNNINANNMATQLQVQRQDNQFNAFQSAIGNGIYSYERAKDREILGSGGYSGGTYGSGGSSKLPPWYLT